MTKDTGYFYIFHSERKGERKLYNSTFSDIFSALFTMGGHWISLHFLTFVTITSLLGSGAKGEIPPRPINTAGPPITQNNGPQSFPEAAKTNLPLFTVDYSRIQIPFEITLWVLLASFAKIGKQTLNIKQDHCSVRLTHLLVKVIFL